MNVKNMIIIYKSLFFLFIIHLKYVIGYNLAIKNVIIKRNIQQKDRPNYFGASVTAHRNKRNNSTWILVGAPGYHDSTSGLSDNNYGGVFKCNFQESECSYVNLYMKPNVHLQDDFLSTFNFSNQWLGVTVQSLSFNPNSIDTNNNVLICGHLTKANYYASIYVVGDCVTINNDLTTINQELENFGPFLKLFKLSASYKTPIFGFSSAIRNDGKGYIIGSPGFFMAKGTSFTYKKITNILGTTQSHWIETFGSEIDTRAELSKTPLTELCNHARINDIHKSENSGYSVANGRVFDETFSMYRMFYSNSTEINSNSLTAVVEGGPGVPVSERLDTSHCSGNLLSGLPVGGTVRLYAIGVSPKGDDGSELKAQRKLVQTLRDLNIGARFGHSVALVDVNGDDFDDLIVGAPYFWGDITYDVTNKKLQWLGAVFIFINSKRDPYFHSETRIKLQPADCLRECGWGAFGFSVTKLGDVNMDGYQDFVVSAPFLPKGGALFLYHGASHFNASAQPVQVLDSTTLTSASEQVTRSFGWTLSGQADVDNNGYPDLLVGAPLAGQVALLRAHPLIILEPIINAVPAKLQLDIRSGFSISMYFTFKPKDGQNKALSYPVEIELEVDPVLKRFSFEGNLRVFKHKIIATRHTTDTKNWQTFKVYWEKDNNPSDFMSPVEIRMYYNLDVPVMSTSNVPPFKGDSASLEAMEERPIGQRGFFTKSLFFDNKCINPSLCVCAISLAIIRSSLPRLNRNVDGANFELRIGAKSADADRQEEKVDESFVMDYSIRNIGAESCHRAYFNITFSKVLNYEVLTSQASCLDMGNDVDNEAETVRCWLNNPFKRNEEITTLSFRFNLSDQLSSQHRSVFLNASVTTVSKNIGMSSVNVNALVKIVTNMSLSLAKAPFNTVYGHPMSNRINRNPGFKYMESEENMGPKVEFRVLLKNKAKGFLPTSYLTIWWPFETLPTSGVQSDRGKFLLYMVHRPRKVQMISPKNSDKKHNVEITCDEAAMKTLHNPIKEEFGFPLRGLPYSSSTDIEETALDISTTLNTSNFESTSPEEPMTPKPCSPNRHNQTFTYSCAGKPTARCMPLVCSLGPVALNNHDLLIDIKARLYEFTLLSENQHCQKVRVVPLVQWSIPKIYKDHIIIPDGQNLLEIPIELNNVIPAKKTRPKHFWLIILGSIVGGLIIMALIVWMLIKCQFFRRQKVKTSLPAKQKWETYADGDHDGYYE